MLHSITITLKSGDEIVTTIKDYQVRYIKESTDKIVFIDIDGETYIIWADNIEFINIGCGYTDETE